MLPFIITAWLASSAASSPAATPPEAPAPIEGLTPPPYAKPPAVPEDQLEQDLEEKREQRRLREEADQPPARPYAERRHAALLKEALAPHPRRFLLEISLVAGTAETSGDKSGYSVDPTSHVNAMFRNDPKRSDGRIGLWYGLRLAPFSGSGFYKSHPGTYGSTYFGPMVGVGKIDRAPRELGAESEEGLPSDEIPSVDGWLLSAGVAAVDQLGRSETAGNLGGPNDLRAKGVTFDAPGLWCEARWLRILYGAFGFDVLVGVQSGQERTIIYGGIGAGAWY
jgi:hypothetical protein